MFRRDSATRTPDFGIILAEGLRDVLTELNLIDAADFIAFVRMGQFANVGDLVNSSAELYFKEGTLSFGWSAEIDVGWDRPPSVCLEMEFRHNDVTVFFGLTLHRKKGIVEVRHIMFEEAPAAADREDELRSLRAALGDARLPTPRKKPLPTV